MVVPASDLICNSNIGLCIHVSVPMRISVKLSEDEMYVRSENNTAILFDTTEN